MTIPQRNFGAITSERRVVQVEARPVVPVSAESVGQSKTRRIEVSVVIPCLNEAETVGPCVRQAIETIEAAQLAGEVIVADNGSTDGSQMIAEQAGALVVDVPTRGYGAAIRGGIEAARGTYIVMADADGSYDFGSIPSFVTKLREGHQLVMGNRFKGEIKPGAMPLHHRWIGNPILTFVGRLLFKSSCRDFHCGIRGFTREAALQMNLRTTGMELASEMVVKAALLRLRTTEIPATLVPDGRSGRPHLRSFRDGWRHLRFMLLLSPRWVFLYPGVILLAAGLVAGTVLVQGPMRLFGVEFGVHTLLVAGAAVLVGAQAIIFAAMSEVYADVHGLLLSAGRTPMLLSGAKLELGLVIGLILTITGLGLIAVPSLAWVRSGLGTMDIESTMRWLIPGIVGVALGVQIMLSSVLASILRMQGRD